VALTVHIFILQLPFHHPGIDPGHPRPLVLHSSAAVHAILAGALQNRLVKILLPQDDAASATVANLNDVDNLLGDTPAHVFPSRDQLLAHIVGLCVSGGLVVEVVM
jgi:hypothetical protein